MTCYYGIENDGEVYVSPSSSKKFKDLPVLSCKSCDEFWAEMQKLPSVKKIGWFFGTLPDLSAARPLPKLEELSFLGIRKLSDIHGISVLKNTLKRLRFEFGSGKTITDWSPIGELSELEELVICNNSVISDLHFHPKFIATFARKNWQVFKPFGRRRSNINYPIVFYSIITNHFLLHFLF